MLSLSAISLGMPPQDVERFFEAFTAASASAVARPLAPHPAISSPVYSQAEHACTAYMTAGASIQEDGDVLSAGALHLFSLFILTYIFTSL
jgi:hypothetical protein